MIERITELETGKVKEAKQIKNRVLFCIALSIAAVIVWFLLSRTVKSIGAAILIITAILVAFDTLVFFC